MTGAGRYRADAVELGGRGRCRGSQAPTLILFVAESDNAFLTLPVTEIDGVQRQVILTGRRKNVGERYGRWVE